MCKPGISNTFTVDGNSRRYPDGCAEALAWGFCLLGTKFNVDLFDRPQHPSSCRPTSNTSSKPHPTNNTQRWPPATPTSHCDAGSPSSRLFHLTAASASVHTSSSETVSVRLQLWQKEGGTESSTSVFSGTSKTSNKQSTSASSFLSRAEVAARSQLTCLERHSSRNATRTLTL